MEGQQFVFIGGYMHAGTTLLGQVIGNLPGGHTAPRETKFLEFQEQYRRLYPDLDDPETHAAFAALCRRLVREGFSFSYLSGDERPASTGPASAPGRHLAVFLEAASDALADTGSVIFVEHTGTNVFEYAELLRSDEEVYLVNVVRDPRDVIASKKTRRATVFTDRYAVQDQQRKHFEKSFDAVWDTVSWRTFIRAGEQADRALGDHYLELRYEDLVADPAHELTRVAKLLGIEVADGEVSVSIDNSADQSVRRAGIDGRSVSRWRSVLTPGEAATSSWLARREIARLQYEPGATRPSPSMARPFVHAASEPVVRVYRRFRLGGFVAATAIVRNYRRRIVRGRRAS